MPFLFASLKVVDRHQPGRRHRRRAADRARQAGLGARLLTGSYYGQTMQIWSALLMAALLGCILVLLVGFTERVTQRRMGARS